MAKPEAPQFDLISYIESYAPKAETRIERLLFLARRLEQEQDEKSSLTSSCSLKSVYQLLESEIKNKGDFKHYQQVFGDSGGEDGDCIMATDGNIVSDETDTSLSNNGGPAIIEDGDGDVHGADPEVVPGSPAPTPAPASGNSPAAKMSYSPSKWGFSYDSDLAQEMEQTATTQLLTLETNLNTAQSVLSKDAIRKAHLNIAKHYDVTGSPNEALTHLRRAKDYCNSVYHSREVVLLMAETGLNSNLYAVVRNLYHLDNNITENDDSKIFASKLDAARGVAYLAEGNFKEAAKSFLATTTIIDEFNTVLSAQDLALYGGLTALLTLSRTEIASIVDKNSFRERLEFVPLLREAIHAYVKADYGHCLGFIDALREGWQMDMYLQPHADKLWKEVRGKCIVQYFEPYISVSLTSMVESFAFQSIDEVEDAVADLIKSKEIVGARINGVECTLNGLTVSDVERRKRRLMMRKLGRTGDGLLDEVERMILRMKCVENGVVVSKRRKKGKHSKGRAREWGSSMGKKSFDLESSDDDDDDGDYEASMEEEDEMAVTDLMETDELL